MDESVSDMSQQPDPPQTGPRATLQLGLRAQDGAPWRPVSTSLVAVRSITAALCLAPLLVGAVVAAVLLWPWLWVLAGVLVVGWLWCQWLIVRQVPAISYAELEDELAIRKGRMFRRMVTIPYGRIQYVDVAAGPLMRRYGLAGIEVHTASPASSGDLPGLPAETAEELRERLTALGESRRAGL